ncbi:uncharacterized protein [Battus philenor]|uniref:uncharacterized protein n=1 Tax=Battus philenor TaxID=42288 RepID=UPI0035CFB04E
MDNLKYDRGNILHVYKPVLVLLYVCGFDLRIFKLKPVFNALAKFYCVCLLGSILYSCIVCFILDMTYHVWSLLEYGISIVVLMIYDSKLTLFCCKLNEVDNYLRVNRKHYVNYKNKTIFYTIILWIVRIIYCGFYFSVFPCDSKIYFYIVIQFSLLALDMNRVFRFLLLDAVRCRLTLLRLRLEEDPNYNFYLYIKNRRSYKENKMRFCLFLYRTIADMVDLITPELFNGAIFVSVVCSLPKLIINVYHMLLVFEGHESTETAGFIVVHICQLCFFLFSPCIVMELYGMEVDKIKMFLMHRAIDEKDIKIKEDVDTFLRYTSLRTFRYKMWRCIPVNIYLPVEIASLCTTYVIVLINFTHLYG